MSRKIPRGEDHLVCPLHKLAMSEVCHKCPWWMQIRGFDANTGQEIDDWGCSVSFMPMLLINTANEARQGAAATESFRNEMVKAAAYNARALTPAFPTIEPPSRQALLSDYSTDQ